MIISVHRVKLISDHPYERMLPMKTALISMMALCLCGSAGVAQTTPPAGFTLIPAGSFQMGNALVGGFPDEQPVHPVNVGAFYMENTLVTNGVWAEVRAWGALHHYTDLPVGSVSGTVNHNKGLAHPVVYVNWYDAVKWCNARSEMEGLTPCYAIGSPETVYRTGNSDRVVCHWEANGYRLPTEAEWEKAARGGLSGKRFPWGDTITQSQANYYSSGSHSYDVNSAKGYPPKFATGGAPYTSPVGSFAPNGYGLYDMAGNVWERCWDWYGAYDRSAGSDPRGAATGTCRVFRGGCWYSFGARGCRTSHRGYYFPAEMSDYVGFRSARGSR